MSAPVLVVEHSLVVAAEEAMTMSVTASSHLELQGKKEQKKR